MGQFVLFAIAGLALFTILTAAAVWVRFQIDEPAPTKKPHPIRLTVFMLVGVCFGSCFMGVGGGHGYEVPTVLERIMPLICVVGGALGGIATELLMRWGQRD
jgi:uncharacterized membrane protein YfcA